MEKHSVTVYSTQTCPYCVLAKKYLTSKGVEYKDVDVGVNQAAAMEMVKKSGQMGVPVIDIDGKIVIGFRQEAIDQLLS